MGRALSWLRASLPLLGVISILTAQPALAVVVSTTQGNLTAPEDDFGFANVGAKGTTNGVYLGYRWVLTAAHVGAGSIILNGQTYEVEPGTDQVLLNPNYELYGMTQYTDLRLYRIVESPRLPVLSVASVSTPGNKEVILVGGGYDRESTLTMWNDPGDDQQWVETDIPPGDYRGFKRTSTQSMRWGTNKTEYVSSNFIVPTPNPSEGIYGKIFAQVTDFDENYGTAFEAQAMQKDSGGALFYKRNGKWELSGIISMVSYNPDTPGGAGNTAVFGQCATYYVDLARYQDQILDIITPMPGDATLDDVVDEEDSAVLAANWLKETTPEYTVLWEDGDFNGDGRVDDLDASILAANWGTAHETLGAAPEPASMILLLSGFLAMLAWRTRRRASRSS